MGKVMSISPLTFIIFYYFFLHLDFILFYFWVCYEEPDEDFETNYITRIRHISIPI